MSAAPEIHTAVMGKHRRTSPTAMIIMIALFGYCLLPVYWLLAASTKSGSELFTSFALWFGEPSNLLDNLREVFTFNDGVFVLWIRNTALYSFSSAFGASVIAMFAGYAFSKYAFRGRSVLFGLVLGGLMIPTTALVIPLYLLMSNVGLINTAWAFILPSLINPFGVYLMRIYTDGAVPNEILEAARVDGAGEFRIFRSIVARLLAPGFVTVFLFSLVASWNNYFLPLVVFSDPDKYPLTVGLASWNSAAQSGGGSQILFPLVVTGALVAILPLVAAFLFLQRYWQTGLSLGSVK